jgi:predicted DNA-binding transcriptional regulator AlpA
MSEQTVDRIVRPAEAQQLTGYCDVHLRRLEQRGEFPHRFKLSSNSGPYGAVGWLLSDITAWLKVRAESRTCSSADKPEAA